MNLARSGEGLTALKPKLITLFHETWKYFLVSLFSLLVDQAVFWCLTHLGHVFYLVSNVVSVSAGLVVNYALSVALVFKERRLTNRRAEFIGFVVIGIFGLVVNEAFLALFVRAVGLAPMMAKVAAAGPSFVFNFAARRWILFTARP